MKSVRNRGLLAIVGLIVLGVLASVLSLLALASGKGSESVDATEVRTFDFREESGSDEPSDETGQPTAAPPETGEPTQDPTDITRPTVIVGDSNSLGELGSIWLGPVSSELGWDPLYNLSAPGRGYVTPPPGVR